MKMLSGYWLRAILATCLFTLCACAPARPRQSIVAWHTLSGAHERALLKLIDRWNQTNPDGLVVVPERREPKAQHRALLEGAQSGALPGLALATPAQAALYERNGLLAQLDGLVNTNNDALGWDAADREDLYPFVQQAGRIPQGRLIGVPMGGDARMVLGNRDWAAMLGSPDLPATWDAFTKLCNSATDRLAGTLCFGVNPGDQLFEEWVQAHGEQIYAADTGLLQINSPGAINAIEQLVTFLQTGVAYRAPLSQRGIDDFAAARVLFALDWVSHLRQNVSAIRNGGNFILDSGTLPSDADSPVAVMQAPLWVIPKSDPDRERAAWGFVNWLLETEQSAQWAADTGDLPARASAASALNPDPSTSLGAARLAVLQRVAPHARAAPLLSGWPCVQEEMATGLRQIFEGQVVADTLNATQARAQALLNEDCSTR